MTGVTMADADAATAGAFVPSCTFPSAAPVCMISCRREATPRIVTFASGLDARRLTLSAHVFASGKSRVSTSVNVRCSRRRSALTIVSATSAT